MTTIANLTTDAPGAPTSPAVVAAPIINPTGIITVTDRNGRVIRAKLLKAFDRMRLFKIVGGELSSNGPWFGYATVAASVVEIAGEPVSFPTSQLQIEALVARLDDDGLNAVSKGLGELLSADEDSVANTAKNF